MIKKLIAFGDSFTWGSDFPGIDNDIYSTNTWSGLIAKKFNLDYECVAFGGRSNDSISRHCIEHLDSLPNTDDIFIAIMWTYPFRHEVFLKQTFQEYGVPKKIKCISLWHALSFEERMASFSIDEWTLKSFQENYRQESFSGIIDIARVYEARIDFTQFLISSFKSQLLTKEYLEYKKIPYVFVYSVKSAWDMSSHYQRVEPPKFIKILKDKICNNNSNIIIPKNGGLVDIAKEKNFKLGTTNHPLEEAHEYFANKIVIPHITANIPF